MKLRTSILLATTLFAVCAGAAVVCGRQAYRLGYGSIGAVTLPEGAEATSIKIQGAAAGGGHILTEADILKRVNATTNYSSYGPPPTDEGASSGS